MVDINQKLVGSVLLALSLVLLAVLVVVKLNTDREGAFLCKVVAESPDLSMDDCPAHESSSSWLIMIAFVIAAMLLAAGTVLVWRARAMQSPAKAQEGRKTERGMLDPQEKKLVALLEEHDNSMFQSDLIRLMGLSKAQMTRLLDRMESKRIVERRRRGMANLVILK